MLDRSTSGIAALIRPGRVHRRVYTDPEIFELEMERIYGRAWLFVGHTSQVPNPGDYITTELARQPVIMIRHSDGNIKLLFNRCAHRGAKLAPLRTGHAPRITCCYHGWTFDSDGTLLHVPVPEGCSAGSTNAIFRSAASRASAFIGVSSLPASPKPASLSKTISDR